MTDAQRELIFATARDAVLKAMPDAWAVYVYGSFARAEEWPDSDLDLAVLLPPQKNIPNVLGLMAEISERTGRDVDLVNLRKVGDILRAEVLADGRTLHVADPDAVLAWEASAMSGYARHRDETRGILDDFERTGIGYAK